MEKTFETPGGVRLSVEIHAGLVVVTSTATDRTVVSIEADAPGAEELVRRATVECRPTGDRQLVTVKLPTRVRHATLAPQRRDRPGRGARGRPGRGGHGLGRRGDQRTGG